MLPIPKNSRWDGLVYLHGLLPKDADDSALHRLVLTSGDFGLAYLTERWAARFVSELFRNYVVCFVGYSINDPVLRYMMDALAADRLLGEVTPQAYALGSFKSGEKDETIIEWEAKGVIPILYESPAGSYAHSALHCTLKVWAETYRDGILGKERIVDECALVHPSASTQQDDFVGRMLWALSHESGLPAKRFAEFNPVPSLDWLEVFSKDRYQHGNLDRFGIRPHVKVDKKLRFSLIRRPTPYTHAPWMSLVSGGSTDSKLDPVMFQLARWMVRHLNDPALIIWLATRGSQLNEQWHGLIEQELERFALLGKKENTNELAEIRANAPNAIPHPLMKKLWLLLLTGRVKSPGFDDLDFYDWKARFKRDGLSATLRLQLREILAPKVALHEAFLWGKSDAKTSPPERLNHLVDWDLVLATDQVHSSLQDLREDEQWHNALPMLLDDFQQLLRDALDLVSELDDGDDRSDPSLLHIPSISQHWQNRGFRDWIVLIELLRDAWIATLKVAPERATRIAQGWFALPYPSFKRLALFAASHNACIAGDQWVEWLVDNGSWALWAVDTQRETMRLLVLQGAHLSMESRARVEEAILGGPPSDNYRDETEPEWWPDYAIDAVWLRLAKLTNDELLLSPETRVKLEEVPPGRSDWKSERENERNEFSHWMSGTGDPDYEERQDIDIVPRKRVDLVNWLKQPLRGRRPFYKDTWRETCRTRFFHSSFALCDLAQEAIWPTERWREALQVWSEENQTLRSWRFAAPLVQTMPDDILQEIAHAFTWWLEVVSKSIDCHEKIFLDLCRRLLALSHHDDGDTDQPFLRAINHPIGQVTQALLNFWFKREPNDNDTLARDVESFFTLLFDTRVQQFRHGRVVLASNLIALFRVDRSWTDTHLLPMFDWRANPLEAKAAWEGFLRSPRLYRPLLIAFKAQFLSTAHHYMDLREHRRQFATFLTYAALNSVDGYSPQDFQTAFSALPPEGLQVAAKALPQALEGAGDKREDFWKNRIQSFWQQIWPKSRELASNGIAESLACMSIAARSEFPSALSSVLTWLLPIEHPHYVVHLLHESRLASRFPEEALRLLNAILNEQPWVPRELSQCLQAIIKASPTLEQDYQYQRLIEYARRLGRS
jgi:SIR2-like domain